jgi:hypothetical protein
MFEDDPKVLDLAARKGLDRVVANRQSAEPANRLA